MSTTTTTELQGLLEDYKIHLTGSTSSAPPNQQSPPPQPSNPSNWPTDYHGVPEYRPINPNLDRTERPMGGNAFELGFLTVMFTGVFVNASMAQIWRKTAGPYFPGLFRYAIGGEW